MGEGMSQEEPDPPPKSTGAPSLRDFDYFAEDLSYAAPVAEAAEDQPLSLNEQIALLQRQKRRYSRALTLMLATLAVVLWGASGYTSQLRYDFATDAVPIEMGDATQHRAADYTHNTFIRLTGITEHRGLEQKRVQGLGLRQEFWYFRLVGSQGVFLEVPATKERFGPTRRVDTVGRVVDPLREATYAEVLNLYFTEYPAAHRRAAMRVIQVERTPGSTRWGFLVGLVFVLLLVAMNVFALRRLLGAHRRLSLASSTKT